mmetsp:Transcript_12307/g.15350  ORF Transcript_12307/g.15350 Transcript_12307/m.15350 type:complete len:268 (+) Transcript_12307:254-1057(+)|eukprot:CAMPEP_0172486618 /NCGR_PEP_ID=MMETSP1066-20121228/15259_1 /TAXON_ID=671091 /ORGANISM="Coscinodiscus wailesii, Strain CCMP2513" /LENGTH=267 /DNA_ID=CAMNT_0013252683 /DNA_START=254 /DNA_END=1057 /DNA_ORIENTATION=-
MGHVISHHNIAVALQPIVTYAPENLHIPNLYDFPTTPVCGGMQLPSSLALEIACFLGDADDLDALAATSTSFRAVARNHNALDSLVRPWLPSLNSRLRTRLLCPRSLSRTFQRIQLAIAALDCGWDEVLWQASALGCIHGIRLAIEQGARVDEYSGGRENAEGSALWCAAKFNHLDAVKVLCEEGRANIEIRGGIRTKSSPLWVAAREGNSSIVRYLIERGADTTSRGHNGRGRSVREIASRAVRKRHGRWYEMIEVIKLISAKSRI